MRSAVFGLNHKTAPASVRERFSLHGEAAREFMRRALSVPGVSEAMLLSTCARTELYLAMEDDAPSGAVMELMIGQGGGALRPEHIYEHRGGECARHIFRVASSLDSLVVGEGQILAQLKEAYADARGMGAASTVLNTLAGRAIAVGKRVRADTRVAFGNVSVPSAAVDLASEAIGSLDGASVAIIGAGEMSEIAAARLIARGARTVIVTNRSFERAAELARSLASRPGSPEVRAVRFTEISECVKRSDVVISSTGAPHFVLTEEKVGAALRERGGRPIVLIDIAMPRDIDPRLASIPGVVLHDIDGLTGVIDRSRSLREAEARSAEAMIDSEAAAFCEKMRYLSVRPTMAALHDKAEDIRARLVRGALRRMPGLGEAERRAVEELSRALANKLLREPMTALKRASGSPSEGETEDMASELFGLDELSAGERR